jgi:ketosteroid isomerase-like protein
MTETDFAKQWMSDWNAHDLDAILTHYAPDVEFHSPKVALFTKGERQFFVQRDELRPYFARAFQVRPSLRFDLKTVTHDAKGIALVYTNEIGETGVELMELNEAGLVVRVRVLYGAAI